MRILLLEDEEIAADHLLSILKKARPNWDYLGVIPSVKEGRAWFESNLEPDLIFSDIQLQDGLSFDIFGQREIKSPIIFTTAFDQYAIRAFEVTSIDYLLKPIQEEKVLEALKKIEDLGKLARKEDNGLDVKQLVSLLQSGSDRYKSRFLVKGANKILSIPTSEIAYFHSKNKLTFLVNTGGAKYPVDYSLDELDSLLNPKEFFRVNRAFIIHLDAAREIKPYFKGRLRLKLEPDPEEDVILSNERSAQFKAWLDQ
jgi:two-component system, LytTR family, response regulator